LARAGTLPDTVYPQWIASFARDVLAYDNITLSPEPTSVRMADGDAIVVTAAAEGLLLRRFAPDGTLLRTRIEAVDPYSSILVKADVAADSLYVMTSMDWGSNALLRFDAALERAWSVDIACGAFCDSAYAGLEVLSDGSAVTMRVSHLARVQRDGTTRWAVDNFVEGLSVTASALAVDGDDTIWVAAQTFANPNQAESFVMRFDAQGERLSADHVTCSACAMSTAIDIDVLADGSATVVGTTGSQPASFFARYAAGGEPLIRTVPSDAAVTFGRVTHDANGAIYVGALYDSTVRRIDPETGAVLWTREARDFVAQDDGISTVSYNDDTTTTTAVSYSASGEYRWQRALSDDGSARIGHPSASGTFVDFLVQEPTPSAAPCSVYPHLLSVDAKGSLTSMPTPCRAVPSTAVYRSFDARAGIGALVNLSYALVAYTPDGVVRWRAQACEWCSPTDASITQWGDGALLADGGAWAIERVRYLPQLPDGQTLIKRIDATGSETLAIPAAAQNTDVAGARISAFGDDVIALQPIRNGGGITWQRVRADGSEFAVHNYSIPDPGTFRIDDARLLDDGGVILVAKGEYSCSVGCSPHYVTILRLKADGTLAWRYLFAESAAAIALAADGTARAALWSYPAGVVLRSFDAAGAATEITSTEVPAEEPLQLAGPIDGRWLLCSRGESAYSLSLIDAAGHVVASREQQAFAAPIRSSSADGFLVETSPIGGAELLDPRTLEPKVRFDAGSVTGVMSYGNMPWRVLDDGSVYGGLGFVTADNDYRTTLAYFAIPGSAFSDRVFTSGFD
jgi:outer membrane protein assembly factor BamB